MKDTSRTRAAYGERTGDREKYAPLKLQTIATVYERRRAIAQALSEHLEQPIGRAEILDLGCGDGGQLIEFLELGAAPEHLTGVDLLETRVEVARSRLSDQTTLYAGDATTQPIPSSGYDVVSVFMVLMTILDADDREEFVRFAFERLKPGGVLLVNDTVVNNPRNSNIGRVSTRKLLNAVGSKPIAVFRLYPPPPLNRLAARSHLAYALASTLSYPVRTHRLWVFKRE